MLSLAALRNDGLFSFSLLNIVSETKAMRTGEYIAVAPVANYTRTIR
ncbi:MAG: hypothetical protein LBM98_05645 [Oscillospiraceae bacterium]|nr:hypothetical protein [Oscillospiraceae bacterium]